MIFHPAVDLLGHGCRLAEVYSFHFSPEVLPHQLQELRVKGDALLQEEAVGESDDVVGVIVRQSRRQVLEQRELPAWRTEAHTHIFNSVDNVCTSPLLCNKLTLMLLTLCVCVSATLTWHQVAESYSLPDLLERRPPGSQLHHAQGQSHAQRGENYVVLIPRCLQPVVQSDREL